MTKRILGLAGLLIALTLSVPALADDAPPAGAGNQTTPAANGNGPTPPAGSYPVRNDMQNYRQAENTSATPGAYAGPQGQSKEEMKKRREHWREEQKERRERWREEREKHREMKREMREHHEDMKGGSNGGSQGAAAPAHTAPATGAAPTAPSP